MDSQDETRQQEFDQEVDTLVRKSKRKLSEGQLKALADGRKKRCEKKRSKTSDVPQFLKNLLQMWTQN